MSSSLLRTTVTGSCPGGFCELIKDLSEVLVVILCLDGFVFFVTLVPPIFNWQNKKPDGKRRIWSGAIFSTMSSPLGLYFVPWG
jgi:hypothetical protein